MAIRTGKKLEMEPRHMVDATGAQYVISAPVIANHVQFKGTIPEELILNTFTQVQENLYLDPSTGDLWWLVDRS